MQGVNKVVVAGYLGADPELRTTQGGARSARMRIATNHSHRDRKTNEWRKETEWHRAVAFGPRAEFADKWLSKGDPVLVCGRLQTRKWTDTKGVDRWTTEILVSDVELLARREAVEPAATHDMPEPEQFEDDLPL